MGRAIPELWPLGTEALALAIKVSVLEAKRLGHRAVLRLSWLLLVASVALSTPLQVAVAPPTLVGYLTAGATPVWLLGSFAVLSLLYRTPAPAEPAADRRPGAGRQRGAEQARARLPGLHRPGRRRSARHWRPAGRGRRPQGQLRPSVAGRVPDRPHPHRRPGQRAAARCGGVGSGDRGHLGDLYQLRQRL